jgi:outer membrane receptor protein involved in Fe transport
VQDYTTFDQNLFTGANSLPKFPDQQAPSDFLVTQKNWTGEIRLQSNQSDSNLSWVIGGFFSDAKQTSIQIVTDPYLPVYLFGGPSPVPGFSVYDQNAVSKDKQAAIFGQFTYKLTDQLSAIVGLRYSRTEFQIRSIAQGFVVGPLVDDRGVQKENPLTPKFGLNFQATPDALIYASASRGFRVGGYNPQVGTFCGAELAAIGYPAGRPTNFKSDSVWSYELGAKSRFGGRGSVQASVYQIDWSDIQQAVGLNSCGFQFTSNLGKARSRGFDLQVELKPADRLTLQAELGYVNAKFLETVRGGPTAAAPFVSKGDHVLGAPWTISLHGQYDFDVFGKAEGGYFRTDFDYRSKQTSLPAFLNPANGAIDTALRLPPAVTYWSARLGARPGNFDVSLFVNNILNKSTWTRRERAQNPNEFFRREIVKPRTIGITASYRY